MQVETIRRLKVRVKLSAIREVLLSLVSVRMSPVAFYLDYYLFPPVILISLLMSFKEAGWPIITLSYSVGLLGWTLAEYFLHRFVLHQWPYFSALHKAHHDEPRAMIGSPALFSMLFFLLAILLPLYLLLGKCLALAVFAGFMTGYIAFAAVHGAVHHSKGQGPFLRHFKKLHAIHHHIDPNKNFGVLTGFWDHIFGTFDGRIATRGDKKGPQRWLKLQK